MLMQAQNDPIIEQVQPGGAAAAAGVAPGSVCLACMNMAVSGQGQQGPAESLPDTVVQVAQQVELPLGRMERHDPCHVPQVPALQPLVQEQRPERQKTAQLQEGGFRHRARARDLYQPLVPVQQCLQKLVLQHVPAVYKQT